MGNLQKLKLAKEDKNVATDDAGRRRSKLLLSPDSEFFDFFSAIGRKPRE